jgi:hypothetical protein
MNRAAEIARMNPVVPHPFSARHPHSAAQETAQP